MVFAPCNLLFKIKNLTELPSMRHYAYFNILQFYLSSSSSFRPNFRCLTETPGLLYVTAHKLILYVQQPALSFYYIVCA